MKIYAPQNPAARAKRTASVVVLLAVAVVVGPQAFANDSSDDGTAQEAAQADIYTVAPGDTLWVIASSITPPHGDVRDAMEAIQRLNVMESSSLRAGEQLLIPTSSE